MRSVAGWAVLLAAAITSVAAGQPGPPRPGPYLFVLDLAGTPLDEFPSTVKALNGVMTVVDKNGQHMLQATSPSEFLITLPQQLPPVFTVEVDLIPKACCNPEDFMLEGTPTRNRGAASAELTWHPSHISVVGGGGEMYQADMPADLAASTPGNLTHLVLEINGSTIKLYTNGRRLYTVDKQFARGRALRVWLGGETATNEMYLAGLRVAAGPATPSLIASGGGPPGIPGGPGPLPNPPPQPSPPSGSTSSVPPLPGAPGAGQSQSAGGGSQTVGPSGANTPTSQAAQNGVKGVAGTGTAPPNRTIKQLLPPAARTLTLSGLTGAGPSAAVPSRTIALPIQSAAGVVQPVASRTFTLGNISGTGPVIVLNRTLAGMNAAGVPKSRSFTLVAISASGVNTPLLSRTFRLSGWTAVGSVPVVASRVLGLAGLTAVGIYP